MEEREDMMGDEQEKDVEADFDPSKAPHDDDIEDIDDLAAKEDAEDDDSYDDEEEDEGFGDEEEENEGY